MARYSVEARDHLFEKQYGFLPWLQILVKI